MAAMRRRIAIDFDGVLNSYLSGYLPGQEDWIPDEPVPGALEFVSDALAVMDVVIFTTRAATTEGRNAVKKWLYKYGFPDLDVYYEKPWAHIYLDDAGWQFNGMFPNIQDLLNFETWVEKKRKEKK